MLNTFKIATLNINGIASKTRLGMLEGFLKRKDIDFALLQEVTHANLTTFRRYTAHVNEGTDRRRTAILVKEVLTLSDIKRLPSGRGIAASYNGIRIINVYAPSGAEKRNERESFYNKDMTALLPSTHTEMILAGDFNCVLSSVHCTGRGNYSRALDKLIKGFGLTDVWEAPQTLPTYTHYIRTSTGASRLDRIYVTDKLRKNKKKMCGDGSSRFYGPSCSLIAINPRHTKHTPWTGKMSVSLLNETAFIHSMQEEWERWQNHMKHYPNRVLWWDRYVKRMIQLTFQREGAERRRDRTAMENFYCSAIYQVLQAPVNHLQKATALKRLMAKIIRLHSIQQQGIILDNGYPDRIVGEELSTHHFISAIKRQKLRTANQIYNLGQNLSLVTFALLKE